MVSTFSMLLRHLFVPIELILGYSLLVLFCSTPARCEDSSDYEFNVSEISKQLLKFDFYQESESQTNNCAPKTICNEVYNAEVLQKISARDIRFISPLFLPNNYWQFLSFMKLNAGCRNADFMNVSSIRPGTASAVGEPLIPKEDVRIYELPTKTPHILLVHAVGPDTPPTPPFPYQSFSFYFVIDSPRCSVISRFETSAVINSDNKANGEFGLSEPAQIGNDIFILDFTKQGPFQNAEHTLLLHKLSSQSGAEQGFFSVSGFR